MRWILFKKKNENNFNKYQTCNIYKQNLCSNLIKSYFAFLLSPMNVYIPCRYSYRRFCYSCFNLIHPMYLVFSCELNSNKRYIFATRTMTFLDKKIVVNAYDFGLCCHHSLVNSNSALWNSAEKNPSNFVQGIKDSNTKYDI